MNIEQLNEKLKGRLWIKEDKKRIYLDRGYNTKKMKTTVCVEQNENGSFFVKCFIDCPSQDWNWIKSQQEQVIESVEEEIEEILNPTEDIEETEEDIEQGKIAVEVFKNKIDSTYQSRGSVLPREEKQLNLNIIVGSKVNHARFGNGIVTDIAFDENRKLTIQFEDVQKVLLEKFANITLID